MNINLTVEETEVWESATVEGYEFRNATRALACAMGGHVEIYSDDGIVLDALLGDE
jgi:hypothetical protein